MVAETWNVVWLAVIAQFADLPTVGDATRVLTRLTLAALLGGALGYEREQSGKSAGLRTHTLVALGSALLIVAAQQAGMQTADLSRVIQGIVAGIGFLGVGTIFTRSADSRPHGLTTAAGIWLTAGIGVTAGMGHGATAVFATALALVVLGLLQRRTVPTGKRSPGTTTPPALPDK